MKKTCYNICIYITYPLCFTNDEIFFSCLFQWHNKVSIWYKWHNKVSNWYLIIWFIVAIMPGFFHLNFGFSLEIFCMIIHVFFSPVCVVICVTRLLLWLKLLSHILDEWFLSPVWIVICDINWLLCRKVLPHCMIIHVFFFPIICLLPSFPPFLFWSYH